MSSAWRPSFLARGRGGIDRFAAGADFRGRRAVRGAVRPDRGRRSRFWLAARVAQRRLVWRAVALRHTIAAHRGPALGTAALVQAALALLLLLSPASPRRASAAPALSAAPSVAQPVPTPRATAAAPSAAPAKAAAASAESSGADSAVAGAHLTTASPPTEGDPGDVAITPRGPDHPPMRQLVPRPTATATATPKPSATPTATPTATATPTPTATPNPFAGDTLTDLSKVPDAESVDWPAWVPAPVATAVPGVKGTGQFIMPVDGWISTPYSPAHLAIDIAGPAGSPVLAADTGTVVFAGVDYGGLGYAVEIDHGNGFLSAYGHNSELEVQVGDIVRRGDLIAYRGSTGHSTGPHVHFAIHKDGQPVNPFDYVIAGDPPAPIPQVQAPTLVGLTPAQAQAAVKGRRLTLAWDPPQPSMTVPAGKVATQQQAPNSLVGVDSVIHASLSTGAPTPTATAAPTATPVPATATSNRATSSSETASTEQTTAGKATGAPTATAIPSAAPSAAATATATPRPQPAPPTATPRISETKAASTTAATTATTSSTTAPAGKSAR